MVTVYPDMTNTADCLAAACERTAGLLSTVRDHQLSAATPCEQLSVAELVAHVGSLGVAFAAAARKDFGDLTDTPPGDDGYRLDDHWRSRYPANLAELAAAWRDPAGYAGMTRVGGVDLPGAVAGSVALGEVVIHGWDIAVATGQDYDVDAATAQAVFDHVASFAADGPVEGLFGPAVEIADDATTFERALALSGRDPGWRKLD